MAGQGFKPKAIRLASGIAVALVLTGCGGGGSDDDDRRPPGSVDVTAANQERQARRRQSR
mgnify:CR=1 FL=1